MGHRPLLDGMKWVGDLSLSDAEVLVKFGKSSKRILEFGVGGSTHLLSQCLPEELISLDTDTNWLNITKTKMTQLKGTEVSFKDYAELDKIIDIKSNFFDMIFVDGVDSLRYEFALKTWDLLKVGGVMIFHDTRRVEDAGNVVNTALKYFNEVSSIDLNIADSLGISSNMSVITKKELEPYINWNLAEGKPLTAYHAHLGELNDTLWEYKYE